MGKYPAATDRQGIRVKAAFRELDLIQGVLSSWWLACQELMNSFLQRGVVCGHGVTGLGLGEAALGSSHSEHFYKLDKSGPAGCDTRPTHYTPDASPWSAPGDVIHLQAGP